MSTSTAGRAGEEAALRLLQVRGYKVLARNFRSKFGEIDIIAQDGNVLVFVEVKTRWSKEYGYPEEAVTPQKLRSIVRTAEYYKLVHPNTPDLMRVDVVAVEVEDNKQSLFLRNKVKAARIIKNVTQ